MQIATIQRVLGILLMVFSLTMLPPEIVAWWSGDAGEGPFLTAFVVISGIGVFLWLPVQNSTRSLRVRDGFAVVVLFWAVLSLGGAVPFMLSENPHMSLTNSVFEAVSGLTTTGATVIQGIDELPPSIRYYRQQLQWLGGMGIIVLAVAILPMLRVGGMQLYRAEIPGPMKEDKLTPRIGETAKILWYTYVGLTLACAIAFWLAGMDAFDAIGHSFATLSTGGFSTHDASFAYFDSPLLEGIAIFFMALGGVNFALHFRAWSRASVTPYLLDAEFKVYLYLLLAVSLVSGGFLYLAGTFSGLGAGLRHGVFQTVSFMTTTGFTSTGFSAWPGFVPLLLVSVSFIGGCGGSTGGGMKVVRMMVLTKQGFREIARLIHPKALLSLKLGKKQVPERVVEAIWGFFAAYILAFYLMVLVLTATGIDQITAYSAVIACMNNLGPGLGDVSSHFGNIDDTGKWVMSFAMLLGRLEVFTLLVLLSPAFWRS